MRIHVEIGAEATEARGDCLRLAAHLVTRGHRLSLRGAGDAAAVECVEVIPESHTVGTVEVVIVVERELPADVVANRRIAWSRSACWPAQTDWEAIVGLSEHHASFLRRRLTGALIIALPGGCDMLTTAERPRDRLLYDARPEDGLHRVLDLWPGLWAAFHLPLSITHDLRTIAGREGLRANAAGERIRSFLPKLDQPGIIVHGPLGEPELASLRARSLCLLYPLDPPAPRAELGGATVFQGCAAGVVPLLSPVDALPSLFADVATFVEPGHRSGDATAWCEALSQVLSNRPARLEQAKALAATRPWSEWTAGWERLLQETPKRPAITPRRAAKRWVVVLTRGNAGEAQLLLPLLREAAAQGHGLRLLVRVGLTEPERGPWPVETVSSVTEALDSIAIGTDRLLLCSSTGWPELLSALAGLPDCPPICTLDSTVPEGAEHISALGIVQCLFVAWPPGLLDAAMAGRSPLFRVHPQLRPRLQAVGWLPPSNAVAQSPDPILLPPDPVRLGEARAAGIPVVLRCPGTTFSTEPWSLADRLGQLFFNAGEAELCFADLPAEVEARAIDAARFHPPPPSGDGARVAIRLIEALRPPVTVTPWRPPELRP